jgi:hypothetical protein
MAQTKRKRRSKHRGNAAGKVEARGRTGRPPTAAERKQADRAAARERRVMKPPTYRSAFVKASLMAALLFVFTQVGLFGEDVPIAQSITLSIFALLIYTPLAYVTDKFVYNRAQRRRAQGQDKPR